MSFSGFELVKAPMAGGPNDVGFDSSFSRSGVGVVRVDLGPAFDPSENRGAINEASFEGTAAADRIRISDQQHGTPAAGATVSGLGPTETVTGATQELAVDGDPLGASSNDVIDASGLGAGTVGVLVERGDAFAGAGNDTLIGHPGNDRLFGGGGDDRLEGRGGTDVLDGGSGHNVIIP